MLYISNCQDISNNSCDVITKELGHYLPLKEELLNELSNILKTTVMKSTFTVNIIGLHNQSEGEVRTLFPRVA